MRRYDFHKSVGMWVCSAQLAYTRAFNERLAPHGITFRQAQVIGITVRDGPQPQATLAALMLVEPPSLVGVLDRMEAAGLIARRPCPGDRRKKLVHLTRAAEPVWDKIAGVALEMRRVATAGMSKDELAMLQRLLEKVQTNVTASAVAEAC